MQTLVLSQHGFYARFMDDWLIMVKTKRQLRKTVKITHKISNQIKLKMYPDKTFVRCIKKGFDFLGIHFGEIPGISNTSLENHRSKITPRYAQGASKKCIGSYIERWTTWCCALLLACYTNMKIVRYNGQKLDSHLLEVVGIQSAPLTSYATEDEVSTTTDKNSCWSTCWEMSDDFPHKEKGFRHYNQKKHCDPNRDGCTKLECEDKAKAACDNKKGCVIDWFWDSPTSTAGTLKKRLMAPALRAITNVYTRADGNSYS